MILSDNKFFGYEIKYGKIEKERYPFTAYYLTKDVIDENAYPVPLFLADIGKSEKAI